MVTGLPRFAATLAILLLVAFARSPATSSSSDEGDPRFSSGATILLTIDHSVIQPEQPIVVLCKLTIIDAFVKEITWDLPGPNCLISAWRASDRSKVSDTLERAEITQVHVRSVTPGFEQSELVNLSRVVRLPPGVYVLRAQRIIIFSHNPSDRLEVRSNDLEIRVL